MKFSRIVFAILFLYYLISCQNGISDKHEVDPKKNEIPSTDRQKSEESFPKPHRHKPIKKTLDKEVKKKKSKAIDTLKPLVAIR
ncbi:MAG: hypothetical protein ABJN95_01775 [Maribacter sp.]|uniref:hypothetical protein n=1 Tax=Maribacter sp. TaxID=1897614 RepID=UPI003298042A